MLCADRSLESRVREIRMHGFYGVVRKPIDKIGESRSTNGASSDGDRTAIVVTSEGKFPVRS